MPRWRSCIFDDRRAKTVERRARMTPNRIALGVVLEDMDAESYESMRVMISRKYLVRASATTSRGRAGSKLQGVIVAVLLLGLISNQEVHVAVLLSGRL